MPTFDDRSGPQLVGRYARRANRLRDALQPIGLALGGAAGARLATVLGLPAGRATLLGLIRSMVRQNQAATTCLAGR